MIKTDEKSLEARETDTRFGQVSGRLIISTGAAVCGLAVAIGAIGAHALEQFLIDTGAQVEDKLANWDTAVTFQMYHGLGILLIGIMQGRRRSALLSASFWIMLLGIALFSGGLYLWVLMEWRIAVRVVPIGGVAFILGWMLVALSPGKSPP